VLWTEAEDATIFAASQLLSTVQETPAATGESGKGVNKRKVDMLDYSGSGWLLERMLDQCPPLVASGSKSSKQAVGHRRHLISQRQIAERERGVEGVAGKDSLVHHKRHFDEISTADEADSSQGTAEHPKKLHKQLSSQDRHSAIAIAAAVGVGVDSDAPVQQRPRGYSIGERLRQNVSSRLQHVVATSSRANLKAIGADQKKTPDTVPELMPTHPSHEAATSGVVSNSCLNPVQIVALERHGLTGSSNSRNGSVDSQSYHSEESVVSSTAIHPSGGSSAPSPRPLASLTTPSTSYTAATASPFHKNPHSSSGASAPPPLFADRSSPYLLASGNHSHPIGSSPYLVGDEASESPVPALSTLPPPSVGSAGIGSNGQPGIDC
jgi:hypothetical protein